METVLYNTDTQQLEAKGRKFKSGHPYGTLEPNVVVLEYEETPPPSYNAETQKLEFTWQADLSNAKYFKDWQIIDLTAKELAAKDWKHATHTTRLIVDESVAEDNKGQKHFIRFEKLGNPVEYDQENKRFFVWLNGIEADYQAELNNFIQQGKITIESRPTILNDLL